MKKREAGSVLLAVALLLTVSSPSLCADTTTLSGNDATIYFQVSGSSNINQFTLDIDTNETGNSLGLWSYTIGHSGTSAAPGVTYGTDKSYAMDLSENGDIDTSGVNIDLKEIPGTTQMLRLKLTANPPTGIKGRFLSTYVWRFTIDAPGTTSHAYTITSSALNNAVTPVAVDFPEVNVRDTLVNLTDGSGSHDFGNAAADGDGGVASAYETFTVENTGSANLGISVALDDPVNFDLDTTGMDPTVTPSTSTTFRIRFDPTSTGTKTATVTVTNNDVFEYDYTFTVTGSGASLSALAFGTDPNGVDPDSSTGGATLTFTIVYSDTGSGMPPQRADLWIDLDGDGNEGSTALNQASQPLPPPWISALVIVAVAAVTLARLRRGIRGAAIVAAVAVFLWGCPPQTAPSQTTQEVYPMSGSGDWSSGVLMTAAVALNRNPGTYTFRFMYDDSMGSRVGGPASGALHLVIN